MAPDVTVRFNENGAEEDIPGGPGAIGVPDIPGGMWTIGIGVVGLLKVPKSTLLDEDETVAGLGAVWAGCEKDWETNGAGAKIQVS